MICLLQAYYIPFIFVFRLKNNWKRLKKKKTLLFISHSVPSPLSSQIKFNSLHRAPLYHSKQKDSYVCLKIWNYTSYYLMTYLTLNSLWLQPFLLLLYITSQNKDLGLLFIACLRGLNKAIHICCFCFKNMTLHFYSFLFSQEAHSTYYATSVTCIYHLHLIRKKTKEES